MADAPRDHHDEETLLAVRARTDRGAFAALFDRTLPKIYGYIYRRVGHREVAEDLASVTFEKALAAIGRFSPARGSWNAWIYRIATNVLYDHYRAAKPEVALPEEGAEPSAPEVTTTLIDRSISRKTILTAMETLPERYRSAIALRFFEEKTTEEMMEILSVRRGTLAVLVHRALKSLDKALRDMPL